jgi:ribosome recycling factor
MFRRQVTACGAVAQRIAFVPALMTRATCLPSAVKAANVTVLAAVRCYHRGPSGHGERMRMTEAERRKRVIGKTPEEKRQSRESVDEAEMYVQQVFPDEVEALLTRKLTQCKTNLLKLSNPVLALERTEIEVGGAKRPLVQLGTIVKVSPSELSLTPHDMATQAVIMSRLSRHDHSLNPAKNGDKIRLTIEPVTRDRREGVAADIETARADFTKRMQTLRRNGINTIQELKLASLDMSKNFQDEIARMHDDGLVQANEQFQELIDQALAVEDDEASVDASENI